MKDRYRAKVIGQRWDFKLELYMHTLTEPGTSAQTTSMEDGQDKSSMIKW